MKREEDLAGDSPKEENFLATMSEVLELLSDGIASFTDLEPIRHRYETLLGDDRCWTLPISMDGYLGSVILPVQEGMLCLPYDSADTETYEHFVTEKACLLSHRNAEQLREMLDRQYRELSSVLTNTV